MKGAQSDIFRQWQLVSNPVEPFRLESAIVKVGRTRQLATSCRLRLSFPINLCKQEGSHASRAVTSHKRDVTLSRRGDNAAQEAIGGTLTRLPFVPRPCPDAQIAFVLCVTLMCDKKKKSKMSPVLI